MKKSERRIYVFDTTLRDGQQCPGAGMGFEKNIEYAHLARKLGVDVLEAGFPSASKAEFEIVNTIATELASEAGAPIICGLCQLRIEQIEKTIEALLPALPFGKARLHTYVPVSPALMQASLGARGSERTQLIEKTFRYIEVAAKVGVEVQFSPEGYSRMGENFDFTTDLIRAAVSAGATVINCPDTIGGACKLQGENYFIRHMEQHADIINKEFPEKDITWSVHCHNDYGLAVENTVNAIFDGPARQIEGCVNGIGERAGNASLEQCAMIIQHFAEACDAKNPLFTKINTKMIQIISDFVSAHMLPRQPHFPISGENSAKHSSGGHTNAILRDVLAYQAFNPEETGKEVSLVFGPLSGGNHARKIIEKNGYTCNNDEKAAIAQFVKQAYQDRRKGITEHELMRAYFDYRMPIRVEDLSYSKSENRASVLFTGQFFHRSGSFEGVTEGKDSALAALKKAIDVEVPGLSIQSHSSESAGAGISARSISRIVLNTKAGGTFSGMGEDRDIEISALKALIAATNQAYIERNFRSKHQSQGVAHNEAA
ncbi:2-isopropylmalate synthase [Oligoflexia bacterium]|nr:2-isopropylmalate synthase [Oligoflexia bacterium]